jgi:hypothetical protein
MLGFAALSGLLYAVSLVQGFGVGDYYVSLCTDVEVSKPLITAWPHINASVRAL